MKTMAQTVAALDSPLSLCRVSGSVVCLGSAESSQSLRLSLCAWVPPSLRRVSGSTRIRDSLSRSRREWQPAGTSFLKSALDLAGATTSPFAVTMTPSLPAILTASSGVRACPSSEWHGRFLPSAYSSPDSRQIRNGNPALNHEGSRASFPNSPRRFWKSIVCACGPMVVPSHMMLVAPAAISEQAVAGATAASVDVGCVFIAFSRWHRCQHFYR
jgi:hypothetical protein